MDTITLERTRVDLESSTYRGSDGAYWTIKPNRYWHPENPGRKPEYVLWRRPKPGSKPEYVSGLFVIGREQDQTKMSGDMQDAIGVRRLITLTISSSGTEAWITPGVTEATA